MKRLFTLCAIVVAVVVSSCSKFDDTDIWDKLNDHESRITALEELCKQMNTNITALQTIVEALEKRDYITNVSPVRKDGADGKDGYTPQIGVMKDTDGIYYWTLDGEWLLDGKGNKIQANGVNGIDGTNGNNGQDGTNGVDGITPRLKIENDYWYVSYDEGATWIELGKATGEDGSNGIDGVDGDSIFSSVTQDDEYVYFNLADGTMITLPKHDKENIQFEDLRVKAICCKNWDTNYDGELSYTEAEAVTDISTVFASNTDIIAFTELKYFTGVTEIPTGAFYNCTSLWKIELPSSITTVKSEAFLGAGILNLTIPDTVTVIEEKSLMIGKVGQFSFGQSYKDELKWERLVIGKSVELIGSMFYSSGSNTQRQVNVETLYFRGLTPPQVYTYSLVPDMIYVPIEALDVYKSAEYWKNYADVIMGYDFNE